MFGEVLEGIGYQRSERDIGLCAVSGSVGLYELTNVYNLYG